VKVKQLADSGERRVLVVDGFSESSFAVRRLPSGRRATMS